MSLLLKQIKKEAKKQAQLSKKQALPMLRDQFIAEHPAVGTFDEATGKPVTEKLIRDRANAYVRSIEKGPPAVFRRELMRLESEIERVPETERKIISPEDLLGKVGVPVVGDRSIRMANPTDQPYVGAGIGSIRGVPLDREIFAEGGIGFSADSPGTGKGWASMRGIAAKKQGNIRMAAEETGREPIGIYSALGMESIDFSTPALTAMIAQIPAIGIPKRELRAFDKTIREGFGKVKGIPEWVGLEDEDVFDQILGRGNFSREGSGALRIRILDEMKKKRWQNVGFPRYDDVVETFTRPDLVDIPPSGAGMSMFRADPEVDVFEEPYHMSYDTVIPAKKGEEYFGGLVGSVPPEVMFPSIFEELSQIIDVSGKPLDYQSQRGSLMMNPKLYEEYTPEKIDQLIKYMNETLGTDYAEGGEVSNSDAYRQDGSLKSETGFIGPIINKHSGKTMTELSVGVVIGGREIEIPSMVPTLSKEERIALQNLRVGVDPIPQSIIQKAKSHAIKRIEAGLSPFFEAEPPEKSSGGALSLENVEIF